MTILKRNAAITLAAVAVIAIFATGVTLASLPTSTHSQARSVTLPTTSANTVKNISFENKVATNEASGSLNFVMKGLNEISPQLAQAYADQNVPVRHMTLVAVEKSIAIPSALSGFGVPTEVMAYTFNGTIPGPSFRVTQGEIIEATVIDPSNNTDNHSVDNHASQISAVPNFTPQFNENSTPGGDLGHSKTYYFVATAPGYFEYHCEGNVNDLAEHVFRGMQGGVIVDPANGYQGYDLTDANIDPGNGTAPDSNHLPSLKTVHVSKEAKEVVLDFSEYYLTSDGDFDWAKMYNHNDTFSYINGIPFGYQPLNATQFNFPAESGAPIPSPAGATPLLFNVGDHVRFFVLNTGDFVTNFHIVGEQLDRVDQGGMQETAVQTFNVGGSNSAIVDVTFTQPGAYVIVNHEYSQLGKGQFAVIVVQPAGAPSPLPSNAIAPSSELPHTTIPVSSTPYTFGTPLPASCLVDQGGDDWTIDGSCTDQVPVENGGTVDTTN